MTGDWREAKDLLDEAVDLLPEEPLIISLMGLYWALTGSPELALESVARACSTAKTFGHAHHTYYQIASIFSLLGQHAAAFEWLERSVSSGFACWPFFLKDACLQGLRGLPEFETWLARCKRNFLLRLVCCSFCVFVIRLRIFGNLYPIHCVRMAPIYRKGPG